VFVFGWVGGGVGGVVCFVFFFFFFFFFKFEFIVLTVWLRDCKYRWSVTTWECMYVWAQRVISLSS